MSHKTGEKHHNSKLNYERVKYIRENYKKYCKPYRYFAEKFNVSDAAIRDVVHYVTWYRLENIK